MARMTMTIWHVTLGANAVLFVFNALWTAFLLAATRKFNRYADDVVAAMTQTHNIQRRSIDMLKEIHALGDDV
jgi:hypothetical protein